LRIHHFSLILTLSLVMIASPVVGGVKSHTVRQGESLSSISAAFYGDKTRFNYIALYNSIKNPANIIPGYRLKLPYSDRVTLRKGESISLLAKRIWGNSRMFTILGKLNGITRPESVSAGTSLAVPVLIPYRLSQGETLSTVARDLMGDPMAYDLIAIASKINKPESVPIGTLIKVPVVLNRAKKPKSTPQARPKPKPAKPPKAVPAPSRKAPSELANRIGSAEREFRQGNYQEAKGLLLRIEHRLIKPEHSEALRILASCHYAYGDTSLALDTLRKAYTLDPSYKPRKSMVNPELMKLHYKAKKTAKR